MSSPAPGKVSNLGQVNYIQPLWVVTGILTCISLVAIGCIMAQNANVTALKAALTKEGLPLLVFGGVCTASFVILSIYLYQRPHPQSWRQPRPEGMDVEAPPPVTTTTSLAPPLAPPVDLTGTTSVSVGVTLSNSAAAATSLAAHAATATVMSAAGMTTSGQAPQVPPPASPPAVVSLTPDPSLREAAPPLLESSAAAATVMTSAMAGTTATLATPGSIPASGTESLSSSREAAANLEASAAAGTVMVAPPVRLTPASPSIEPAPPAVVPASNGVVAAAELPPEPTLRAPLPFPVEVPRPELPSSGPSVEPKVPIVVPASNGAVTAAEPLPEPAARAPLPVPVEASRVSLSSGSSVEPAFPEVLPVVVPAPVEPLPAALATNTASPVIAPPSGLEVAEPLPVVALAPEIPPPISTATGVKPEPVIDLPVPAVPNGTHSPVPPPSVAALGASVAAMTVVEPPSLHGAAVTRREEKGGREIVAHRAAITVVAVPSFLSPHQSNLAAYLSTQAPVTRFSTQIWEVVATYMIPATSGPEELQQQVQASLEQLFPGLLDMGVALVQNWRGLHKQPLLNDKQVDNLKTQVGALQQHLIPMLQNGDIMKILSEAISTRTMTLSFESYHYLLVVLSNAGANPAEQAFFQEFLRFGTDNLVGAEIPITLPEGVEASERLQEMMLHYLLKKALDRLRVNEEIQPHVQQVVLLSEMLPLLFINPRLNAAIIEKHLLAAIAGRFLSSKDSQKVELNGRGPMVPRLLNFMEQRKVAFQMLNWVAHQGHLPLPSQLGKAQATALTAPFRPLFDELRQHRDACVERIYNVKRSAESLMENSKKQAKFIQAYNAPHANKEKLDRELAIQCETDIRRRFAKEVPAYIERFNQGVADFIQGTTNEWFESGIMNSQLRSILERLNAQKTPLVQAISQLDFRPRVPVANMSFRAHLPALFNKKLDIPFVPGTYTIPQLLGGATLIPTATWAKAEWGEKIIRWGAQKLLPPGALSDENWKALFAPLFHLFALGAFKDNLVPHMQAADRALRERVAAIPSNMGMGIFLQELTYVLSHHHFPQLALNITPLPPAKMAGAPRSGPGSAAGSRRGSGLGPTALANGSSHHPTAGRRESAAAVAR